MSKKYHQNNNCNRCKTVLIDNVQQIICARHFCKICNEPATDTNPLLYCIRCTNSYHASDSCFRSDITIIDDKYILCPKHSREDIDLHPITLHQYPKKKDIDEENIISSTNNDDESNIITTSDFSAYYNQIIKDTFNNIQLPIHLDQDTCLLNLGTIRYKSSSLTDLSDHHNNLHLLPIDYLLLKEVHL